MKKQVSFSDITKQVYDVYGQHSVLPIIYGAASIYRDHIVDVNHFFPVLYLKGGFASGKTSLSNALQHIFSESKIAMYEPVKSLDIHEGISQKGITILDEYNSGARSDVAIKAAYDNAEMKKANANMKVDSRNASSAMIVISLSLPTDLTILKRVILVCNDNNEYSPSQIKAFDALQEFLQIHNCNCVSELAIRSEFISNHYKGLYDQCKQDFLQFSKSKGLRIIDNYATIITVFDCLKGLVEFPFGIGELYKILDDTILEHECLINPA